MNKDAKKYYKDLKLCFTYKGEKEKRLLNNILLRLSELNDNQPDISYTEICSELGSPYEITASYFNNAAPEYLSKKMRVSFYWRNIFISFLIVILLFSGLYAFYLHKALEIVQNTNIVYEDEILE